MKRYISFGMRKARLPNVQRDTADTAAIELTALQLTQILAEHSLRCKKKVVFDSAMSGHKCFHELDTRTVIRDIFAAMTEEEFATWLERIYPEPER